MICEIEERRPCPSSAEDQRKRICWLLGMLDAEQDEPSEEQVSEALSWLSNIESIIPDHQHFVANSFAHFWPAWHDLLKGAGR
jgi:hypothetical protein